MLTEDLNIENQQQVWDRFREGDDTAYSLIYKEYAHVMFSFGMRFTTDRELVKDCIQDIFVKLYSKRQQLNSTGSIKFYLLVAMKNELFNIFRKNTTNKRVGAGNLNFPVRIVVRVIRPDITDFIPR